MNTEELISLIKNFNKNAQIFIEIEGELFAIKSVSAEDGETILETQSKNTSLKNWEFIFILNNLNQPLAPVFTNTEKKSHYQLFGMRFHNGNIYLR